jgi:hypothetical protein
MCESLLCSDSAIRIELHHAGNQINQRWRHLRTVLGQFLFETVRHAALFRHEIIVKLLFLIAGFPIVAFRVSAYLKN